VKRSLRVPAVTLLLLAGVGGLCTAWYVSSRRALDAELHMLEQRAAQATAEKEREIAESLSKRLEELRLAESQRPYFHYQNLYHDPKGASQGLSVVPSPLASGPSDPLVSAYFQIDSNERVTLPTINDELVELNAPDVPAQSALRDTLAAGAGTMRAAAAAHVEVLEQERRAATRIAALEARLAASAPPKTQQVLLDPNVFAQNVNATTVYRELKSSRPPPPVIPPAAASPVKIRSTDFQWRTLEVGGKPRLVALRAVLTPADTLVQGVLISPIANVSVDRKGTPVEGTGWRVRLDPIAAINAARAQRSRDWDRFLRLFVAVCGVLLAVVAGVVWVLSRVEKLATDRARFAATAAHELRTPLASLRLYSDLIAEEENPAAREKYARELASQTERLGRVVANVLEVTRLERGTFALKPRPGAIGALVEECVARLRPQLEAAQCRLDLHVAGDLPQVSFDPDALHHVVDNLVDNAEKFSREVPDRSISVAVAPEEGGVAITVSDRGPGVPEDLLRDPRPFRRASSSSSPAGLGLGLFLVDRIVRGHGGALRSVQRPGGGASVQVFLPSFRAS
jgi:signal transduction histidine kinase